jgi:DNA-binding MarR family transcriptional regulator
MRLTKAENSIFFLLSKASQCGSRYWTAKIAPYKVTAVQGLVLAFLREKDRVTATELRSRIHIDSATLTGVLDRLEATGWLNRQKKPDDRRALLICLTPNGRDLAEDLGQIMTQAGQDFLADLSDVEAKLLRSLLRKIREDNSG